MDIGHPFTFSPTTSNTNKNAPLLNGMKTPVDARHCESISEDQKTEPLPLYLKTVSGVRSPNPSAPFFFFLQKIIDFSAEKLKLDQ